MFLLQRNKLGGAVRQMDIADISNDLIHLTNNRYRAVIKLNSINFELKSEEEQDAIIDTYESFLNSIGFPIQIMVRTRAIDIDDYIEQINRREQNESQKLYKTELKNYGSFVRSLVTSNKILSKNFYIVVPLDINKKSKISLISEQINIRIDIILKNLNRLSITGRTLSTIELVDLFYSFYNPQKAKIQPISNGYINALGALAYGARHE